MEHTCSNWNGSANCEACLSDLRVSLDNTTKAWAAAADERDRLSGELKATLLKVGRLQNWVDEYGVHYTECNAHSNQRGTCYEGACDCGLAALKSKPTEKRVDEQQNHSREEWDRRTERGEFAQLGRSPAACVHEWGKPSCTTGQKTCQKCLATLFGNGEILDGHR